MKTDYEVTGRIYAPLEAYVKGNCSQAMPNPNNWYYFATSTQFKTCKNFADYLTHRYGQKFKTNKVTP